MTKPRRGPSGQHSRSRLQRAHRQTMSRLTRAGSSPLCIHPHRDWTKSMKYVIFTSTGVGDFVIISANILGENTEVPNVRLQLFLLAGLWSDSSDWRMLRSQHTWNRMPFCSYLFFAMLVCSLLCLACYLQGEVPQHCDSLVELSCGTHVLIVGDADGRSYLQ